jgi:hypothetical protein
MSYFLQRETLQNDKVVWVNINTMPDELQNLVDVGGAMNYANVRIVDETGDVIWQPDRTR